jgi:uncharacterized damage-inducible protein DinB
VKRTRVEDYWRLFAYERDSHAKVLAALGAVPPERRSAREFCRAATLFAHIIAARRLWLFRMGAATEGPGEADMFPPDMTLQELARRLDEMHTAWADYLGGLDDHAIWRHFEYRSFEGQPFRNTVADILTQLYGHSLYHRGQIALLLRDMGAEPALTDFLFWSREAIGPAGG